MIPEDSNKSINHEQVDRLRRQFERWFRSTGNNSEQLFRVASTEEYFYTTVEMLWQQFLKIEELQVMISKLDSQLANKSGGDV